jgi:hypothetical protein
MHAATFLAVVLPLGAPALKDPPAPPPTIVGRWECTALVVDGGPNPQWKGLEYEFTKDGKWIIYRDGRVLDDRERTYQLDPKIAGAIDVTEGPRPSLSSFRVEKDTLKLAIASAGGGRPDAPETTGKEIMNFTFQRVKTGK